MSTKFKDLNIKPTISHFVGEKLKMTKILNKEIKILGYKIKPSKFENAKNKDCLYLQIEFEGQKRIVFTSGVILINMLDQIPKENFPIDTTISNENDCYELT